MRLKWYRDIATPFGYPIHMADVAFVHMHGRTWQIRRLLVNNGRVARYVINPYWSDLYRFNTLKAVLAAIRIKFEGMVPEHLQRLQEWENVKG